MNDRVRNIKWVGLIPSLNVFSGESEGTSISLISKGDYYELRVNKASSLQLKRIEKAYLSIKEKKAVICKEFDLLDIE